jgi:hypothetical protein
MSLIERSDNDFEGFLRILILVVLGNYRKHKVTQFIPTAIRALAKENVKYVQNII